MRNGLKMVSWGESKLPLPHLIEYNFEILFLESGLILENRTLRVKIRYEIFLLQKKCWLSFRQQSRYLKSSCEQNGLPRVGEVLLRHFGDDEGSEATLWQRRISPPNCGLQFCEYRFKCFAECFCFVEKNEVQLKMENMQKLKEKIATGTFEFVKLQEWV